jgi:putative transposase
MYKIADDLCFKSKNLYNEANYILRHEFFDTNQVSKYNDLTKRMKITESFKALGSNSAQHTLKMLEKSWKSFSIGYKKYQVHPEKFLGEPQIPKYKKKDGRHICVLTNWQTQIKNGYVYFAFKPLKPCNNLIRTKINGKHMGSRIVPKGNIYVLEIIYEVEIEKVIPNYDRIISIDLGVNNFATLTNNIVRQSIL